MKLLLQRVTRAAVRIASMAPTEIGPGLLVFVAIEKGDNASLVTVAAAKICGMRIFPEEGGTRLDRSVEEIGGEVLVVSQFTLAASIRRGRRPSFDGAAHPSEAEPLCVALADALRVRGLRVSSGVFGATMSVELVNDGPVTIWLQSGPDGEFGP